eukprot:TRINITY_DN90280_c0_g1_i1.p1 TRINITY_DN90280_c0_g1~~TRINITY_DN90280_c0_g1_i1.p1  ORF type:complete len:338 (-),score=60.27 TRINITY_DN90280_c0_g1_i1:148-1089(-)
MARRSRRGTYYGACLIACGAAASLSFVSTRQLAPVLPRQPAVSGLSGGSNSASAAKAAENQIACPFAAASVLGLTSLARQRRSALKATGVGGGNLEDEVPFEIRGFSLAQVILGIGLILTFAAILDYFVLGQSGAGGWSAIIFIYAVPALLLGTALQYAELAPVPVETDADAVGLFDAKATETLKKIKSDVTRHRYGDDAHLDTSLKALRLVGPGRYPQLQKIIEKKTQNGELEFNLIFQSKDVPFTVWSDPLRIVACDRFFGPGVWSEISKYDSGQRMALLKLTTGPRPADKPAPVTVAESSKALLEEGVST